MATISERLDKFEKGQEQIIKSMDDVKLAISGSKELGIEGIVNKVEKHEEYIEGQKKFKWMAAGVILLASILLTTFVNKLFQ